MEGIDCCTCESLASASAYNISNKFPGKPAPVKITVILEVNWNATKERKEK